MTANTVTFRRPYGCLRSITIKHELRKSVELANVWDKKKASSWGDRDGSKDERIGQGTGGLCSLSSDL